MTSRRAAVLLGAVLVAGCSGGGDDRGERGNSTPAPSPETVVGPPPSQRFLRFERCDGSFLPERSFLPPGWRRGPRAGPVRLLNLDGLSEASLANREAYTLRLLFPPSRLVTIGVEGKARSRVGFVALGAQRWSGLASDLYPAVLIEDCPEPPPELDELPAGRLYAFVLSVGVRREACVPLLVTRNGGRTHRRVVSFGAGDCGAST
jgi:hypothetical protein